MAVYFSLTRKGSNSPEKFSVIDEELCEMLIEPVDPVRYVFCWFDIIGLFIAIGKSYSEIRVILNKVTAGEHDYRDYIQLTKIVDYLEANYDAEGWRG